MSKKEIAHLESINAFYERGDYMDELMIEREMDIIKRYVSPGKSALEVGCGSGSSTVHLSQMFDDLEVIEPATKNTDLLYKRLPSVVCSNVLLEDFVPKRKYDFIFFLNVIEHVEDPVESLIILSNLIKDEGIIFISAPNCMSLNRRAGYKMGTLSGYDVMAPKDIEVGHRRLYTVAMLNEHCVSAGLRVIDLKGMYLKPLSEAQMTGLDDKVVRAFYALGEDVPEYCASLLAIATKKYY